MSDERERMSWGVFGDASRALAQQVADDEDEHEDAGHGRDELLADLALRLGQLLGGDAEFHGALSLVLSIIESLVLSLVVVVGAVEMWATTPRV